MTVPWYLEIVHMSSREKQQDLLTLLRDVVSVTALGSSRDDEHFVIYDCPDRRLKVVIDALFSDVDPSATRSTHQARVRSSLAGESPDRRAADERSAAVSCGPAPCRRLTTGHAAEALLPA